MAIEDSAVLAKLFGHLVSKDQITSFLYAFQELRQGRTKSTRLNEMTNIQFISMPDNAGGIERDAHFRSQRDVGVNPVEDESADVAALWETLKELWCYDAEDEADDWWVGWGMLRLRSQQIELEFGMEIQVSTHTHTGRGGLGLTALSEHPNVPRGDGQVMNLFRVICGLCYVFLCRLAISAYTIPSRLPPCGLEIVHYIHSSCICMYLRTPCITIYHAFVCYARSDHAD